MGKTHRLYQSHMVEAIYRESSSPWTLVLFESAAFIGEAGEHSRRAFLQPADITAIVISSKQETGIPLPMWRNAFKLFGRPWRGGPS